MRKIILNVAVSLDGFIEGPNGEYDWCLSDQDYGMTAFFAETDAIFIGRKSYDMICADTTLFPVEMIYVFSDTLPDTQPENVTVIRSVDFDKKVDEVISGKGGNIWLFGGAEMISAMMNKNLVSEMLLSIHPIILGAGTPLFQDMKDRVGLTVLSQETYNTGLIQVRYAVKPRFDAEMMKLL
jgi:dihydrofolate reductase